MRRGVLSGLVAATALLVFASSAFALPNGGFGKGNLSKWGHYGSVCSSIFASAPSQSRAGSERGGGPVPFAYWDHYANAFTDSVSSAEVPAPIGGHGVVFLQSYAAVGVLHRTFRVPRKARRLQFRLWWKNFATASTPMGASARGVLPPLWAFAPNLKCPAAQGPQFISVDLLKPNAPVTSRASKHVLKRLWVPVSGRTPYTNGGLQRFSRPIKGFRGKRVKFRLGVVSAQNSLIVGFDELRIR